MLKAVFIVLGDPRRPYPTDLEMRSGLLGQMNNPSTSGVNGHLPGDALAAGRLPGTADWKGVLKQTKGFRGASEALSHSGHLNPGPALSVYLSRFLLSLCISSPSPGSGPSRITPLKNTVAVERHAPQIDQACFVGAMF